MVGVSLLSRVRGLLRNGHTGAGVHPSPTHAETFRRLGEVMAVIETQPNFAGHLTATLREALGVTGVAFYLREGDDGAFRLANAHGAIRAPATVQRTDIAPAIDAPTIKGPAGIQRGNSAEPAWHAWAPVRINGAALGFIAVGPKPSRATIDHDETLLLTMVAAHAAAALRSTRLARRIEMQAALIAELQARLTADTTPLHSNIETAAGFADIVGSSAPLRHMLSLVEKVAPTTAPVLVTGETGTGKELIARALHALSPRRQRPLISVNCPAIPPALAESELFGHERGAFTDAVEARPGKFELADGGTIFLDEIADLPAEMQVKLLRVLQEYETQRIGSRKVRKLDLRVVAATNGDLHSAMRAQRFREDLYFRLAVVVVHVPPLRERGDDIPMLASHFLQCAAEQYQKCIAGFSADALLALQRHQWPGNVRELRHVVERAALLCDGDIIRREHIGDLGASDTPETPRFGLMIREEKVRRVREALAQTGGNQAAAARLLGISRSNLGRLMKNLGVTRFDSECTTAPLGV